MGNIGHVAVVGATGAVGKEVCTLLEYRSISVDRLTLLASERSAGQIVQVADRAYPIETLTENSFHGVDYAIFSAGGGVSRSFVPLAKAAGCVVIDNSSTFRMDDDVPLIVSEINPHDLDHHQGIIANPNCSTIIMNMVVWPLHRVNPVKRIAVCTYQAASGAGAAAMQELSTQTADVLAGRTVEPKVLSHPIAFNLFSHDTPIGEDGYNQEERKMIQETRKIFHVPDLPITATCVRVPILRAHSESVNLTFTHPMSARQARDILSAAPGVRVVDDVVANRFPMPIDATGLDECLVGRIRQDVSQPNGNGLELFVCGDQIRKGAALNAIQILEYLVKPPRV